MIVKLANEALDCWEYWEKVKHLRKYSGHFKVIRDTTTPEDPAEVTPNTFELTDISGSDRYTPEFMFDPALAEKNEWNVKLLSFYVGDEQVFIAYTVGYLLNDEGKTIEAL